jgi:hypothetical protein
MLDDRSYFRPPKGAKPEEARKWTDDDKQLLIQGIEKYGIGHFTEISKELLPKWVCSVSQYSYSFLSLVPICTL